jgi:hypothetical protein
MWHVCETGSVEIGFTWGDPKVGNDLEYRGVGGRIILKCIFKTWDGEARIGLIWLRRGTYGGCL